MAGFVLTCLGLSGLPVLAQEEPLHLPLVIHGVRPAAGPTGRPPPTPLPPEYWSAVLRDTAVYPGMKLVFFERTLDGETPVLAALYDPPGKLPERSAVVDWYRTVLPASGWRLGAASPGGGRWTRPGGAWLEVRYEVGTDGAWRLGLRRDPEGAAPGRGRALRLDVALPEGALLHRLDLADLLTEEYHVGLTAAEAALALGHALASEGWQQTRVLAGDASTLLRFESGGAVLLASVRSLAAEVAEIGLGLTDCLPPLNAPSGGGNGRDSVYLVDVPAPPSMRLGGYERDIVPGMVAERWWASCADLDLTLVAFRVRLLAGGWRLGPGGHERRPAAASWRLERDGHSPLTVEARVLADGGVELVLWRSEGARRRPAGRASLLWEDVPLPAGADAWRLETETGDGWQWRERYRLPAALAGSLAAWYRSQMRETAWQFERLEPPDLGPGQVYRRAGESLWIEFPPGAAPDLVLSRRRTCASDEPVPPPAVGRPARWLAEMLVYPDAEFEAAEPPSERYQARCASTGLIADWYRTMLERGNWALVSTLHPNDPTRRRLTFARPWERSWPPERRSAWAEVDVEQIWPYRHRILLRRDPSGHLPILAAP